MRFDVAGKSVLATTGGRDPDPSDPLMVFVHGAGNDRTAWQLQTRYFAHHGFGVAAVDLPGHGGSEGPAPDTIADYADWLGEALEVFAAEEVHLVGHSMGSLISLEFAGTHPASIASISLLGTSAAMGVHPDLLAAARADDRLAFELITGWSHSPSGRRGHHPTPGLWLSGTTMRLMQRQGPGVLAAGLTACSNYAEAIERAAAVTCPALVMSAERDMMTRARDAAPIVEALADVSVHMIQGTGHSMMAEQPDEVIDGLAAFLDGVRSR